VNLLFDVERAVHEAARKARKTPSLAAFRDALADTLARHELGFERQVWLPEHWAGMELNCGDLFDFVVEGRVAVVLAKSARELLDREKRLAEGLDRAGLEAGLVVWLDAAKKEDRCRRVSPAGCGTGA